MKKTASDSFCFGTIAVLRCLKKIKKALPLGLCLLLFLLSGNSFAATTTISTAGGWLTSLGVYNGIDLDDGDTLNITATSSPGASAPFVIKLNNSGGVYTINGTAGQTYENICIRIDTPGAGVAKALTLNLNNVHFKGPGVNSFWEHT